MPQLDFSIWLINLLYNWTFLCTICILINNTNNPTYLLNQNLNQASNNYTNWTWH
uniref:ATP synthase complex subunit 8 n=1 Tax=Ophiarachnella infernalis TaxID=2587522 RepID=A0A513X060_9ECHI|nr:ATP synthase F0 subunit 8 [Ophiarachnella infernalis]